MIDTPSIVESLIFDEAVASDIPQLCGLLGNLFSQEPDFSPNQAKQSAGLRLAIENPEYGRIFVARHDSDVIGMINLLILPNARQGGMELLFEDLIVRNEFRGQGIATRLLEHAFEYACKIGAVQTTLLTEPSNDRAMSLYRKVGFCRSGAKPMRLSLVRRESL